MAFVCKSERVLKFNPNDVTPKAPEDQSNPNLGPGVYLGPQKFISQSKPALAPFQSNKIREVSEVTNINPGPGEYRVNLGFDKNNFQQPLLETILSKIQRHKPGFNSKEERFHNNQHLNNGQGNNPNVGPGMYEANDNRLQWVKSNKNLNLLRARSHMRNGNQVINQTQNYQSNNNLASNESQYIKQKLVMHHSPPSIPSGDFKFGYKVELDGYHVISLKALETDKIKPEQRRGPGAYQNLDGFIKNSSKLIAYQHDTSKRTKINLEKPTKILGPGSYDLLKPVNIGPTHKNDPNYPSSMFASQTKRYSSVDPLVKNKNKLRVQLRKMTHHDSIVSRNGQDQLENSNIINGALNQNDSSYRSNSKLVKAHKLDDSAMLNIDQYEPTINLSPSQNNLPRPPQLRVLKKDLSNNFDNSQTQRSRSTLTYQNQNIQSQLQLGSGIIGDISNKNDYTFENNDEFYREDFEVEKLLDKMTPGPGQYIGQDKFSSFKKDIKPPKYQFFGSQAERFQDKRNLDSMLKQNLGPGCYQYDQESIGQQRVTFKTVGFSTEIDRFYVRDRKIPGPGFYKNSEEGVNVLRNPLSHNKLLTAFGSYEKRFVMKDNKIPGPGDYKPERSIQALQNKKTELLSGSSAFLAQDTERRIADPVLEHSPPVGSYNPDQNQILGQLQTSRRDQLNHQGSISKLDHRSIMKNASQSTISARKIQTLRSQTKDPVAFNTEVSRFDSTTIMDVNKDKLSPIRGPGYYNPDESTSLKPKKGNIDYFTQSKRFEHGSYLDRNKIGLPGPGQYTDQNNISISKRNKSFNLMFN